jgi:hypothetical protein
LVKSTESSHESGAATKVLRLQAEKLTASLHQR